MAYSWVKGTGSANCDRSSLWRGAVFRPDTPGEKAVVDIFCTHYQHLGSVPLTKGFGVPLSLRLGGPRHSCVHVKCTISLRTWFIQDFSVPYTGETVKGAGEMIRLVNIFHTSPKT